jgi:hypothetical protein
MAPEIKQVTGLTFSEEENAEVSGIIPSNIYITVFVTRGRHFGAQESSLIIFFRGVDEKKY